MIVDPFYQNIQIALFKSTKIFPRDTKNFKLDDVMVKSIMYCTKADSKDINFDVKMIVQYYDFHYTAVLKEIKVKGEGEEESDGYDSEEEDYYGEYDS